MREIRMPEPCKQSLLVAVLLLLAVQRAVAAAAPSGITPTERGAVVETARYRAEFRDGALVGFFNKLTSEAYLRSDAPTAAVIPHLPSGLATQASEPERQAAAALFEHYWWEQPNDRTWPNQHAPHDKSDFTCTVKAGDQEAELVYRGLTSGAETFPDEAFILRIAIDPEHGDLLVTPAATSPRGGVYGAGFAMLPLASGLTVEAPIFDGIRLDAQQHPMLWVNVWGSYWDYGFLAVNGKERGAVGLWCQDAAVKTYKALFYLINDEGLSLSVQALNTPPFNELKEASPMTWRLQAFDKSWAQAAARYRAWRVKNVRMAPRPEWVGKVAFMQYGMHHVDPNRIAMTERYFAGEDINRVLSWAPAVRAAGFDKDHSNNTPYEGFRADLATWNAKGHRTMTYLQPMIMWGPDPKTDRERQAVAFSQEAMTRQIFHTDNTTVTPYGSQHNLGSPRWQRWFLDWVREYIQDYGTSGIYHDQSYAAIMDARGAAAPGGMTSAQGMAEYFYKAATENPGSIHGTEHLTEVNSVGASLGLGSGIIWGTPGYKGKLGPKGSMNWQRVKRGSPVSNALHAPYARIFGFPHQSDYCEYGAVRFHEGMEIMERRGDMPTINLGAYWFFMVVPVDHAANEVWLDRQRALAFVHHGLTPVFPEEWERHVLSYFRGDAGADFRYEQKPWGTAFVRYTATREAQLQYARISGVPRAAVAGGILGWPCYDEHGPSGLKPDGSVTYVVEGGLRRPTAWFALPDDDLVVADGYVSGTLAFLRFEPVPGRPAGPRDVVLNAPAEPRVLWVDGQAVRPASAGVGRWKFPVGAASCVVALFAEVPSSVDPLAAPLALCRAVDKATKRDHLRPEGLADCAVRTQEGFRITPPAGKARQLNGESQIHLALRAPDSGGGVLRLAGLLGSGQAKNAMSGCRLNGKPVTLEARTDPPSQLLDIPLKAGEPAVFSFAPTTGVNLQMSWLEDGTRLGP